MSSTSDEAGHTATPWHRLQGFAEPGHPIYKPGKLVIRIVRARKPEETDFEKIALVDGENAAKDAEFMTRAVNSHDSLVKALEKTTDWIVALAASGDAGFWDGEKVEEVIEARAALSQAKGGK
jgi:hypothetical protein